MNLDNKGLKDYQKGALYTIQDFLKDARVCEPAESFAKYQSAQGYRSQYKDLPGLEGVPYICTRVPTGGGKTLMAAFMISIAAEMYLETDHPVVLWMVPSDVIRKQTLEVLNNKQSKNYQALQEIFGDNLCIFDIAEFNQYRKQDMTENTCIFVATFASLRITNTDGRKVYAHNENFEPHFSVIPDMDYLEHDENGQLKYSFANVLTYLRPLILVDEAHNNKSALSEETLRRFRPSAIIEFTATPASNSNVLYKVSAAQLKAEDMIKLPIELTEGMSVEETISNAIQKRNALEEKAKDDEKYIRPLVLFQAEPVDREFNVEYLKKHLLEEEHIKQEEIAVATGDQKELTDIDLFDPACQIRYIITVEALKEGWDCSFAYVLCSLAKVSSSTSAEQFLGRIMRMPFVTRRKIQELNKAYAFTNVDTWDESVSKIKDNLVDMGFDKVEAEENVDIVRPRVDFRPQTITVPLTEKPDDNDLRRIFLSMNPVIREVSDGHYEMTATLHNTGEAVELQELAGDIFRDHANVNAVREAVSAVSTVPLIPLVKTPSQKGIRFEVPQLCLDLGDGEYETIERETFYGDGFDILAADHKLETFYNDENTRTTEFDVNGERLNERLISMGVANALMRTNWSQEELIAWLDGKLQSIDIPQQKMNKYILDAVSYLEEHKGFALDVLVKLRYKLAKALEDKLSAERSKAIKTGYQTLLFGEDNNNTLCLANKMFFATEYPARAYYTGSYAFQKHFFPSVGDFDSDEELTCAKALDSSNKVEYWVRNIDRQPSYSFWLQTSTDKFYPDFVAKLKDGRILVVEHKGEDRYSNDDSKEKRALGRLWSDLSHGETLFIMTHTGDEQHRSIEQQINDAINN